MKITANATVEQSGTVDTSGAVQFGFDASGMSALAGLLQNMYSDTSLAVLREYFCNAMDSHRAAGVTRPVEVTLPADMNPSLVIQDFGLGLSQRELVTVYSTYGSSTKRDSDEAIGGFGIGSKAAFSMAEQFIVTGVKDGEKTVMLFSIGKAGMGEAVTVSHTFGSTDPNGVIVSIPIRDVAAMERTAAAFFTTWRSGTVLVDGDQPVSIFDDSFQVGDRFHISAAKNDKGMTLVMGGVGYPVDAAILRLARQGQDKAIETLIRSLDAHRVLVEARVGDADITPSREALRDTDRTVDYVRGALVGFAADIRDRVLRHVDAAPTFAEAASRLFAADGAAKFLPWDVRNQITWHGQVIKLDLTVPAALVAKLSAKTNRVGQPTGKYEVRSQENLQLRWQDQNDLLVVTGVTTDRQWGLIRRKFKAYQTLENHPSRTVVLGTDVDTQSTGWLTWGHGGTVETISYDEYAARVKHAVIAPSADRGRFQYETASSLGQTSTYAGREMLSLAELREATELIWLDSTTRAEGSVAALVGEEHPDATWIVLSGSQTPDALRKRLPEATFLGDLVAAMAERIIAETTPEVRDEVVRHQSHGGVRNTYFVRTVLTNLRPLTARITNARFLQVHNELIASQANAALHGPALLVSRALTELGRRAGEVFGGGVPTEIDTRFTEEFPLVSLTISGMDRGYLSPTHKAAALDALVAHINTLSAPAGDQA